VSLIAIVNHHLGVTVLKMGFHLKRCILGKSKQSNVFILIEMLSAPRLFVEVAQIFEVYN
jgi:hypothetical protein